MESTTYLLLGLITGVCIGFWLRHQFEFLKVRGDSVFNRKSKASELDEKPGKKTEIPVRKDRYSKHIN